MSTTRDPARVGPLSSLRVLEFAAIGPAPFAGMMLADLGAEVIRIDRSDAPPSDPGHRVLGRGRRSIALDLKDPAAVEVARRLVARSDALIEGFRPGVMERMSLGPDECLGINPRLVFGRVTGWGQEGPLAQAPGHDINYIALSGLLDAIGTRDSGPVPPLNLLDGGAHFYGVFECADGRWISLAAVEPRFYAAMLRELGLDAGRFGMQYDAARWPALREEMAAVIRRRTRDEWTAQLEGSDVCFAPVLSLDESPSHHHNDFRGTFMCRDGLRFPSPAPRFSVTPAVAAALPDGPGADGADILRDLGFEDDEIVRLAESGAFRKSRGG